MPKLTYTEAELLTDHDYASPHVIDGTRLHGGFDTEGAYVPPRSLGRVEAMAAWTAALAERGGRPLDADSSLLTGPRVPNLAQHRLLLERGAGQTFWNSLTITGKIEARGRLLAEMEFPDLQPAVVDDLTETAVGHLNSGLLFAHGIDEGGEPDKGIGGHDAMWFVARDLAFGPDAFDDVEPPERIGRPETGERLVPEIPGPIEGLLSFLMNLLIIEFRAEIGFAVTQEVLRTPGLFTDRTAEAAEAAEIIERIRTDEKIHVSSLCLYLGELRSCRFRTADGEAGDGATIDGAEIIDRLWADLVHWATVEQPELAARQQHELIEQRLTDSGHAEVIPEFQALSDLALR